MARAGRIFFESPADNVAPRALSGARVPPLLLGSRNGFSPNVQRRRRRAVRKERSVSGLLLGSIFIRVGRLRMDWAVQRLSFQSVGTSQPVR